MKEQVMNSSSEERIKVLQQERLDFYEDTVENFINLLIDKTEEGWERIRLELGYDSSDIILSRYRDETYKEYEKRMKLLEKRKSEDKKKKEERRKLYEDLRKEFE